MYCLLLLSAIIQNPSYWQVVGEINPELKIQLAIFDQYISTEIFFLKELTVQI